MAKGMFDGAALDMAINKVLLASPDIPADATGAFLTVATHEAVQAVIAIKVADNWVVKAAVTHDWGTRTVDYGVSITGTF